MSVVSSSRRQSRHRRSGSVRDAASLIPHIRHLADSLSQCDQHELLAETESVRQELVRGADVRSPEVVVAGLSLAAEALRRSDGISLYDVQLLAAVHLTQGRIAQMQTGEGKTFVAIAAAAHFALTGRGVHVMTPNSYLAERDSQAARNILTTMGLTVGMTPERGQPREKRAAYDCDITYGTGHEFGFDYLRDQLTLRKEARDVLGTRLLQNLRTAQASVRSTMQRGLLYAVVDEADSVMFDDAVSPLVLSMAVGGTAPDLDAHLLAHELAERFRRDKEFRFEDATGRISLTTQGMDRCYEDDVPVPASVLMRPWTTYVEQALRARHLLRRDVHYVLAEDEVRIVDQTTGRIFEDRSWQDGLHQAIEVKEGLTVTPEKVSLAQITRQRFFRLYENLCGMTGTAVGCEAEFNHVYRCQVADIPLHRASARTLLPTRFFSTREAKLDTIAADTVLIHDSGQPVLIGTQSIIDSQAIATRLQSLNLPFEVLNGLQTAEEAEIVAGAGRMSAVTIATNLAGRGTDIAVPPEAQALGGLHVMVAECQLSSRMDRQLIGRCARQGVPGSARMYVSGEDDLIVRFGRWLADAIRRDADADGEASADFTKPLTRLQKAAEKQQFLARAELLRQDIARDNLFRQN
ncbi:MAG: hypothetical protein RIK87_10990 [Fuerstiella sp.]